MIVIVEEEEKISFWKKLKISIFGLEDYQKLAVQKVGTTIGYIAKLTLIFVLLLTITITCKFGLVVENAKQYISNEFSEIHFENNILSISKKENQDERIVIEEELLNGKIIIDTNDLAQEQIDNYTNQVKDYTNGIIVLKDKIIFKTGMTAVFSTISLADIGNQYNIVKLDKQDLINMLSGSNVCIIYAIFFASMYAYLFAIYFSTVLIDAILYSILGYITGALSRLRLKYSATYNIAVHSLTLPIILNLIYMIVNILTGYTIKYFDIMYLAITCIYIITAILMIKSDLIKKQIELSRIISEQEKVRAELERKEQEKKEEEERERIRKEDERKRKEEKEKEGSEKKETKKKQDEKSPEGKNTTKKREPMKPKENNEPEPQANIKERTANE